MKTGLVTLSGKKLNFDTTYNDPGTDGFYGCSFFRSSGGYELYVDSTTHNYVFKHDTKGTIQTIYRYNQPLGTWNCSSLTLPNDFGYITSFDPAGVGLVVADNAVKLFNKLKTICPYIGTKPTININSGSTQYNVTVPVENGTLATQEWVGERTRELVEELILGGSW